MSIHPVRRRMAFVLCLLAAIFISACAMPVVSAVRNLSSGAKRIQAELFNDGASDLDVRFASSKAVILPESLQLLDDAAAALETIDKEIFTLQVIGHTDTTGPADQNLQLSQLRAKAVVEYLQAEKGIPWWFMTPLGKGETAPKIDPEKTSADRAVNRRVELRLIKKENS